MLHQFEDLCITGYGYRNMFVRICQTIGRHFKHSVDMFVVGTGFTGYLGPSFPGKINVIIPYPQ